MAGKVFGRLTVISRADKTDSSGNAYWLCQCQCGRQTVQAGGQIRSGNVVSCGCWGGRLVHGHAKKGERTKEFQCWASMRARCEDSKHKHYARYGGRGIKVCERWQSFVNFLADMGTIPPGLQLDRINNDGDYEPSNCRWATRAEQQRNKSVNRFLTYDGVTLCHKDWSSRTGIPKNTIAYRVKVGWPVERILRP